MDSFIYIGHNDDEKEEAKKRKQASKEDGGDGDGQGGQFGASAASPPRNARRRRKNCEFLSPFSRGESNILRTLSCNLGLQPLILLPMLVLS